MKSIKEESFLGEKKAGKLYSSSANSFTIGIPANAFLFVVSFMAFLVYVLIKGYFDKFKTAAVILQPCLNTPLLMKHCVSDHHLLKDMDLQVSHFA